MASQNVLKYYNLKEVLDLSHIFQIWHPIDPNLPSMPCCCSQQRFLFIEKSFWLFLFVFACFFTWEKLHLQVGRPCLLGLDEGFTTSGSLWWLIPSQVSFLCEIYELPGTYSRGDKSSLLGETHGCRCCPQIGFDWPQIGQIWDFLISLFCEPKCTENWS